MSAGIDEPGGQVLQAGQDIETVPGWTSPIAGEPWTASELWLSAASIDIRRVAPRWSGAAEPSAGLELSGPPELTSIGLADVVGVDHIGDDPDGLAILEFALAAGNVVHARLPESFVDEVVAALQRSRAGVPPTFAPAPAPAPEPEPEPEPMVEIEDPPPPPKGKSGSKSALAAEVRELRDYLDRLGFPERRALRADIDSLVAHRTEVLAEVRAATLARREQEVALVRVRREAVLQDVGIYRPRHPAEDSVALRSRLETTQAAIEELVKAGDAVSQYQLSGFYRTGRGVPQDDKKAFEWMLRAAERGHAKAQLAVGAGMPIPDANAEALRRSGALIGLGSTLRVLGQLERSAEVLRSRSALMIVREWFGRWSSPQLTTRLLLVDRAPRGGGKSSVMLDVFSWRVPADRGQCRAVG